MVGENLACSSGEVIYRNDLIELIQYTPTTKTVHEIPLLLCPPWINKYYIMDLAPGKSLVEWAVHHGKTTFAISYRNPGSAQRKLSFEDYLISGRGRRWRPSAISPDRPRSTRYRPASAAR